MSLAISSAIPNNLVRYSAGGLDIDFALESEGNRLASALQHFEATCQESGYALRVSYLSDELRSYARGAGRTDDWVGRVGIGFFISDSGQQIIIWAERIVGFALVASLIRNGQYLNISLGWVRFWGLTPSGVRTFLGITATRIRFENFLKYWDKAIGKVALVLYIAIKWAQDFRDYSGTELVSALVVDALFALVIAQVATWVGGAVLGLLAGVSLPVVVVGGLVVAAVIGVTVLLDWAFEGLGIRDWAISALDKSINWAKDKAGKLPELASNAVQTLDEKLFVPVARTIATGFNNVTNFVDAASQRFRKKMDDTLDAAGRVIGDKAIKPTEGEALELRHSLHDAMDGWGTDENATFSLLENASDTEKQAVLNDKELMNRLRTELGTKDMSKVSQLLYVSPSPLTLEGIATQFEDFKKRIPPRSNNVLWPTSGWQDTAVQLGGGERHNITEKERLLLEDLSPIELIEANNIFDQAMGLGDGNHNGPGDALRHAVWAALLTREFDESWARDYTNAHEDREGNPTAEEFMDRHNNALGILIASQYPDLSEEELIERITEAIDNGAGVYISGPDNPLSAENGPLVPTTSE